MPDLEWERIRITTPFALTVLLAFSMQIKPDRHAYMQMKAYVDPAAGFEEMKRNVCTEEVRAAEVDEFTKEEKRLPLFAGLIEQVSIEAVGGQYIMHLEAVSATRILDDHRSNRSFQNIQNLYMDVIEETLSFTPQAAAVYAIGEDHPIRLPVIQYEETDWTFIRRMASHFGLSVYPKTVSRNPALFVGLPETGEEAIFGEVAYETGISERYYEIGGDFSPHQRADFLIYHVESRDNIELARIQSFREETSGF